MAVPEDRAPKHHARSIYLVSRAPVISKKEARTSLYFVGWLTYTRVEQVKRARSPPDTTRHIEARGAGKRQPLTSPKSSSMRDFVKFFQFIYKEAEEFKIWDPVQAMGWQIAYEGHSIPIGVASVWHELGPERQLFQMSWLSGCTAVIAVVSGATSLYDPNFN